MPTLQPLRFLSLLIALLCMFLAYPLALYETGGATIVNAVTLAVSAAAIYSLRLSTFYLTIAVILGVPAVALDWLCDYALSGSTLILAIDSALYAAFHAFITIIVMRSILAARRVSSNEVWAAACVYLLLALVWADVYHLLATLRPMAFQATTPTARLGGGSGTMESDLLYYSLTTLTTLGIGDIMPADRIARSLTALEAIAGQLCLAIFVARFVGLHISEATRKA